MYYGANFVGYRATPLKMSQNVRSLTVAVRCRHPRRLHQFWWAAGQLELREKTQVAALHLPDIVNAIAHHCHSGQA